MTRHGSEGGKKLAVTVVLIGLLVAGLKRRQHANVTTAPNGGPIGFSKSDWKSVAIGVKDSVGQKNLPTLAAGVAYYLILALFPTLAAAVAISALLITTEQLDALVNAVEAYLPSEASGVVGTQLQTLVSRRTDNLLVAGIAVAIALFSASGASRNLVIASNAAYGVRESRGWLAQQGWGLVWTVMGLVFGLVVVVLLAANQGFLRYIGFSEALIPWLLYGRWLVILLLAILGLAVFYRYGPNRSQVRWQWVSWGATVATVVWFVATLLFFTYVQNFANYSYSYSLFAGIIILMIWMNLSALIILLGAAINHQLEEAGQRKWGDFLRRS